MEVVHSLARLPFVIATWFFNVWVWQHGWNWLASPLWNLREIGYGETWAAYCLVHLPLAGIAIVLTQRTTDRRDETEKWLYIFVLPVVYAIVLLELWAVRFFVV